MVFSQYSYWNTAVIIFELIAVRGVFLVNSVHRVMCFTPMASFTYFKLSQISLSLSHKFDYQKFRLLRGHHKKQGVSLSSVSLLFLVFILSIGCLLSVLITFCCCHKNTMTKSNWGSFLKQTPSYHYETCNLGTS